MKNIGWISRLLRQQPSCAGLRWFAGSMAAAMVLAAAAGAAAQQQPNAAAQTAGPEIKIPAGYTTHRSVEVGGRITNNVGSGAMYNTLVNLQSGPRLLNETFEMHATPDHKTGAFDDLNSFASGFGGEPNSIAKLDFSKSKVYEFSGIFRRDRLYSDYNLLGNPNLPAGLRIPIGPSTAPTGYLPWSQLNRSAVLFNTVRRMTDVNVTIAPFATFSYRFGYSHGTLEGPSLSPSYTPFGMAYNALLRQYERNGSDDYSGAVDWKPRADTKVSLEVTANHYKSDTFFNLDPGGVMVQESDGTHVYLGNYTSFVPYGTGACNASSMGGTPLLSAPMSPNGLPIVNAACAVMTSYTRSLPTRIWTPTETLRFQSAAIKNVAMNGHVSYTLGNSDMPNYYEASQGLNGSIRNAVSNGGYGVAHRAVVNADYGFVWQATSVVSLGDQLDFSSIQQPGYSIISTPVTLNTPSTAGNQTVYYNGPLTPGTAALPHGVENVLTNGFFGQGFVANNLTVAWDATARARFSLTYRFSNRKIGEGVPHTGEATVETDPASGSVTINENGGIFNAALHPTNKWDLNGTVEVSYFDNVFTPVSPRQYQQYRLHTLYRASGWATFSGSFSDRERHNNTNNIPAADATYYGPLQHQDHSRIASVGAVLAPNDRYSLNLNYSYSDVFAATNICYANGATTSAPGAATLTPSGAPNLCRDSTGALFNSRGTYAWFGRDFMDAPTQFGSVGLEYKPVEKVKTSLGYTVSAVDGTRFFNDARDVNGSLVSTYQSPFLGLAWTIHNGLTWRGEYNFYGYGEGGQSGAPFCTTSNSANPTVVPCSNFSAGATAITGPAYGATTPRNFHANNVVLAMRYEF